MSRPHHDWWSYVKTMIRRYPERKGKPLTGTALQEFEAVQAAIDRTERMSNGAERMKVIDLVFWKHTYTLPGAALQVPCAERTASGWSSDFIREVARNFRCDSLLD